MNRITTLFVRDRVFEIVQNNDGWYLAVDRKYIDENGKCTRTLNGIQMHASRKLNHCLDITRKSVEIEHLMAEGFTLEEIIGEIITS